MVKRLGYYDKLKISNKFKYHVFKITSFDSINDDDRKKIKECATKLRERFNSETYPDEYYYRLLFYIFGGSTYRILKLRFEERIALVIEVIDPEFDMYKIYEEFCNINDINDEIKRKFSFFDENLIRAEKLYIQRFDKIDNYSFIKKLEP